ncbi:hypothetical protein BpHYR1_020421 [Brachionus plicatilis]|uniref:Uncharacterized protein n=1 Tax=Brachionus plicatilis TaxID=10195 RepID=A0A3M7T6P7_BRAPC|nr:hypothetical protein BpHYR1_020421 [Brachionus plicatilis]
MIPISCFKQSSIRSSMNMLKRKEEITPSCLTPDSILKGAESS